MLVPRSTTMNDDNGLSYTSSSRSRLPTSPRHLDKRFRDRARSQQDRTRYSQHVMQLVNNNNNNNNQNDVLSGTIDVTTQPTRRNALSPLRTQRNTRPNPSNIKVMIEANEDGGNVLPKALPPGIAYAAAVSDFGFLADRNVFTLRPEEKVHLTAENVNTLFNARSQDQGTDKKLVGESTKVSRLERFYDVINANCQGSHFVLRQAGLGPCSIAVIGRTLAIHNYYTVVDLSGNPIGDTGARFIARMLRTNSCITVLRLLSCDIGADGAAAIADAMIHNVTLTHLDLSGLSGIHRNHLGVKGCQALGAVLGDTTCGVLSTLKLSSCGMNRTATAQMLRKLCHNRALTELSMANNTLAPMCAEALAEALTQNVVPLETLDLTASKMGVLGIEALAPSAAHHSWLQVVHLSRCNLNSSAVTALAALLVSNTRITQLSLDQNNITDGENDFEEKIVCLRGLSDLQGALVLPSAALQVLNLSRCYLPSECGDILGTIIARSHSLTKLDISNNFLEDAGIRTFASAIEQNTALRSFYLDHNRIGADAWLPFFQALRYNSTLQHLRIAQGGPPIAAGDAADVMALNTSLQSLDFTSHSDVLAALHRNKETWQRDSTLRLESKITVLLKDEHALLQTQEQITEETRLRERTIESFRIFKEKARLALVARKTENRELEEVLSAKAATASKWKAEWERVYSEAETDIANMDSKARMIQKVIQEEADKRVARERKSMLARRKSSFAMRGMLLGANNNNNKSNSNSKNNSPRSETCEQEQLDALKQRLSDVGRECAAERNRAKAAKAEFENSVERLRRLLAGNGDVADAALSDDGLNEMNALLEECPVVVDSESDGDDAAGGAVVVAGEDTQVPALMLPPIR
eukprot:PhM_4_TR15680/c0_g1_i2/m.69793